MAAPLLGFVGLGRIAANALPQAVKAGGKNGGEVADITADFFKNDKNKDNLSGKNGNSALVQGFKDLMSGLSGGQKDALLSVLKNALGMDDKAFEAFSTLFKGGKFSDIPASQLMAAGQFLYNMVS